MLTGLFDWVKELSDSAVAGVSGASGTGPAPAPAAAGAPAPAPRAGDTASSPLHHPTERTPPPTLPTALPPTVESLKTDLGERFIERGLLGKGGMGTVLRVYDQNLAREVAMKVIGAGREKVATEAAAFFVEARMTAQLDHPNVIPVHELGVDAAGRAYFVMRMVEGQTLHQRVLFPGPERPFEERLQEHLLILLKVCDAISFAHSRGLIHCDLKPQNIMTGAFGEAYVLDWGIARWKTQASLEVRGEGECIGTPAYMAPEQARGETAAIDERTDVFGLGAILYFLLAGRAPYAVGSAVDAMALARERKLQHPQEIAGGVLPPALCDVVMKALSKAKSDRYQSAAELRQAIERCLRGGLATIVKTYPAGATILSEGEYGQAAYVITRGRCSASKIIGGERRVIREMGPGDVFGEIGVILGHPRTASVTAIDDVMVQVVSRDDLEKGLSMHPWLERIVRALTERFRELDAKVTRGG